MSDGLTEAYYEEKRNTKQELPSQTLIDIDQKIVELKVLLNKLSLETHSGLVTVAEGEALTLFHAWENGVTDKKQLEELESTGEKRFVITGDIFGKDPWVEVPADKTRNQVLLCIGYQSHVLGLSLKDYQDEVYLSDE